MKIRAEERCKSGDVQVKQIVYIANVSSGDSKTYPNTNFVDIKTVEMVSKRWKIIFRPTLGLEISYLFCSFVHSSSFYFICQSAVICFTLYIRCPCTRDIDSNLFQRIDVVVFLRFFSHFYWQNEPFFIRARIFFKISNIDSMRKKKRKKKRKTRIENRASSVILNECRYCCV